MSDPPDHPISTRDVSLVHCCLNEIEGAANFYHLGNMNYSNKVNDDDEYIIIIDTEGCSCKHYRSSRKRKLVSVWIKSFCLLKFYPKTYEYEIIHERINDSKTFPMMSFPLKFDDEDEFLHERIFEYEIFKEWDHKFNIRSRWKIAQNIHGIDWDEEGIELEKAKKLIKDFIGENSLIFAKGKFFEDRFLNEYGLFGETVIEREYFGEKKYRIIDLNLYKVEKFQGKHDPEEECKFFLDKVKSFRLRAGSPLGPTLYKKEIDLIFEC